MPHDPNGNPALLRGKLKKLLLYRLLLAVFILLLTLAVTSGRKEDLLSPQLKPLYIFSCILFVFTIIGALYLERARHLVRFAWVQLLFDIGAVTVLVYMSGGVDSSFSLIYTLIIISSALLLSRRASLLTASACGLVYGVLLDLLYFGWISPLQIVAGTGYERDAGTYFFHLLSNIAGFYLVAFLAGYLAGELQKSSKQVREHQRDLRRLSTLYQSIVQSMPSGLLTIDSGGRIAFLNHTGQEILGIKVESIAGKHITEVFPELDITTLPGSVTHPERVLRLPRLETSYAHPSGEPIQIGYSASILQSRVGEPFGWIINFTDLKQLKEMEEQMQRTDRLVFAGRIAAEIAHEIKNPLAAMSGAVQMLKGELGHDPLHARLTGIVEREISRINELVTDFLWMAKGSPKPGRVDKLHLCTAIHDILSLLKAKNQLNESHTLHTSFEASPLLLIDPHHFRQILWNLFINALEAMPEGGELCVGVSVFETGENGHGEIRIDIADSGPGIPESARQRIFDPFFTTKGSGMGLGLSIVCQLVEKAGGRIEVCPKPEGTGTLFSVFFPYVKDFSLAK